MKALLVSLDPTHLTPFQLVLPGGQHLLHISPTGQSLFTYEQFLSQVQSLSHGQPLELNFMINAWSHVLSFRDVLTSEP